MTVKKRPYKELEGRIGAVLTGDVVGSSKLPFRERDGLLATLREGWEQVRTAWPRATPAPLEIYSGDGWQTILVAPEMALRTAIFMRAYVRAHVPHVDTRIAIAIGRMEHFPSRRVNEAEGEAFRLSGRTLDEVKSQAAVKGRPWMRFRSWDEVRQPGWDAVATVLDALIRSLWTQAKSRAMIGKLLGRTQEDIAATWPGGPIQQSAVSRRLLAGAWAAIETAVDLFEHDWRTARLDR